jgi:hypothetical protein
MWGQKIVVYPNSITSIFCSLACILYPIESIHIAYFQQHPLQLQQLKAWYCTVVQVQVQVQVVCIPKIICWHEVEVH